MRLRKLVKLLTLSFIGQVVTSCGTVEIKDGEACADFGVNGAHCNWLFHDEPRELTFEQWDRERFGMICTKSANFKDWQADIQKLCAISKRCSKKELEFLNDFFLRLKAIDETVPFSVP